MGILEVKVDKISMLEQSNQIILVTLTRVGICMEDVSSWTAAHTFCFNPFVSWGILETCCLKRIDEPLEVT